MIKNVHETTHVWQFQNGGTNYVCEALWAQQTAGYGYFDDVITKKKTWVILNPEQQGQFVQDAFRYGYFNQQKQWNDPNRPNQADRQALIQASDKALPQLRSGRGAT